MKKNDSLKLFVYITLIAILISQQVCSGESVIIKEIKTKLHVEQDFNTTSDYEVYSLITRSFINAEVTNNIVITPTRVNYTSINKLIDGWIINMGASEYGTQVMTTTIPREEYDYSISISYINLDTFLSAQFITEYYTKALVDAIKNRFVGNITDFRINIEYVEHRYYEKIPVLVFRGYGYLKALSPRTGNISASFDGYLYMYAGLPLIAYGIVEYRVVSKAIGISNRLDSRIKYRVVEYDFVRAARFGYFNINGLEVIIGGLPGSNITIYGYANQSQLVINNTGKDIGYVLIKSREPVVENISGYLVTYTGYKIYGVLSNSSRVVNITSVLDKDTVLNTSLIYFYEKPLFTDPVVLTITITTVLVVAFVIIYKYTKSPKKRLV